jgi:hypothetical protein
MATSFRRKRQPWPPAIGGIWGLRVTRPRETIALPTGYGACATACLNAMEGYQTSWFRKFMEEQRNTLFPSGPGSERMLSQANQWRSLG